MTFTFDITSSNASNGTAAGDPDGIDVINVSYHLTAAGAGVRLVVPPETVAIARTGRSETDTQLTPGTLVTAMFLFPITSDGKALGSPDGDSIRGLKGQAGNGPGVGELSVHAHADPNVFAIFPGDIKNTPGTRTVNVV